VEFKKQLDYTSSTSSFEVHDFFLFVPARHQVAVSPVGKLRAFPCALLCRIAAAGAECTA
jgi:hypothetical protein